MTTVRRMINSTHDADTHLAPGPATLHCPAPRTNPQPTKKCGLKHQLPNMRSRKWSGKWSRKKCPPHSGGTLFARPFAGLCSGTRFLQNSSGPHLISRLSPKSVSTWVEERRHKVTSGTPIVHTNGQENKTRMDSTSNKEAKQRTKHLRTCER